MGVRVGTSHSTHHSSTSSSMSMADFEKFFADTDADGNGSLTEDELIGMMKKRGYSGSDGDLKAYFRSCDVSGDGKISKDEYLKAMGLIPDDSHMEARFRAVFREYDKDGSGKIDAAELQQVFAEMGKTYSTEQMERMISLADADASGTLEYEEFIAATFGRK